MTTEARDISREQCDDWRTAYKNGSSPHELASKSDATRRTILQHITDKCMHEGGVDSIPPGRAHPVTINECQAIRLRYDGGDTIEELLETSDRRWRTLVTHLTGRCSHDEHVKAPAIDKETVLRRDTITESDCERFRRGVQKAGSIMEFANSTDTNYEVILAHVNGECSHDIDILPREPRSRRKDISKSECRKIRQAYRSAPEIQLSALAEEFEASETTVERHIHFRCSHPPGDTLVTDVEAVQDILRQEYRSAEQSSKLQPTEISELSSVDNGDPKEASQDLAEPNPDRIETTRSRIIRNTELAHDIKEMYDYTCQVCGDRRQGANDDPYAEAHHIRPLGAPHDGPDEPGNILVLCPNHHADFDYGQLVVNPKNYIISHKYDSVADGSKLSVRQAHSIEESQLVYHNQNIATEK